jgi:hypothetical protein
VVAAVLLTWLVPYAAAYLDDPADEHQNRCDPQGRPDPVKLDRPGHLGEVLKIRLTDAGEFVDRCELTDVLFELNWDSPPHPDEVRPNASPGAKRLPKFVVLYIHGWKHSAAGDDGDVEKFRGLIGRLARANASEKQVLGVYVGWNATSKIPPFDRFPLNNLTFWSKQRVADRIAQSAVTTKIVSAIGSVMSRGDSAANQFITVGHSFGARILFSATNQSLIHDVQKAHPGYRNGTYQVLQGIANAVILLNPAFEAARYTALDATTRKDEQFANDQLPLLLSVSSDGDWATKAAFPLGQLLGSTIGRRAEITTLGNYIAYQTHSLLAAESGDCDSPASNHLSERFVADGLCLARDRVAHNPDGITQELNPFLIARTTSDIIKDHNDIWNDNFSEWLFAYVNELGNQRRPRLLDKEAKERVSAAKLTPTKPSIPTSFEAVDEH